MVKQITFIHAADLHIDSPFKGFTHIPESIKEDIRASTFTALDQLVRTAIAKQVDFVLLVGDLFDHELRSLKAQVHVRNACEQLQAHSIDVYMSFGNHDYLKGAPFHITYPENVYVFESEEVLYFPFEKNDEILAHIYGFSYENKAVTTNKSKEFQKEGKDVPFHIGMLHGSIDQQTDHEPYAPFRTSDLLQTQFDYWALGHVHQRAILHEDPPIIYPGNTQGRHRRETGEKGCYYVTMSEQQTIPQFVPLHSIEFVQMEIDIQACTSIEEVEQTIQEHMNSYNTGDTPTLIHVICINVHPEIIELEQRGYIEELRDVLNSTYMQLSPWKYVYTIKLENDHSALHTVRIEDHFLTELRHQSSTRSIDSMIESLYEHPQARKFLQQLSTEEKETIKQDALDQLMLALVHKRGKTDAF